MPIIAAFFGIVIKVFHLDHNPPHIHASYGGKFAAYDIKTGRRLYGKLPARAEKLVKEWLAKRRIEVMQSWGDAMLHRLPRKVKPLE